MKIFPDLLGLGNLSVVHEPDRRLGQEGDGERGGARQQCAHETDPTPG